MKIVAIIPARRGSKRIPNKNLEMIGGRSLVEIAIDLAAQIAEVVEIMVTTDDHQIARMASARGASSILRPSALCADDAPTEPVIHHAFRYMVAHPDAVLVLQPTSPLRNATDIRMVITKFERLAADAVMSVTPARPNDVFTLGGIHRELRSAGGTVVVPNGAIYCLRPSSVDAEEWYRGAVYGYEMDPERSIDIDTESDLKRVREILES